MKASKSSLRNTVVIPTGIPKLDNQLDGGVGLHHITQFSGQESVGKTTAALGAVVNAQKMGLDTLWLDSEQRFPFEYAELLGVNLDDLELVDKQHAEAIFDYAEEWAGKHKKGLIVLDSIGGLLTRKEAEKNSGEEGFPEAPKLIPGFIRRIVFQLALNGCALILLNHEKVDFMTQALKVLGGKAVLFHSDKWIRFRRTVDRIKQGDDVLGDVIEITVQKGKKKGQKEVLHLMAGEGFSSKLFIIEDALAKGVLIKEGQFYFFNGEKMARGLKAMKDLLEADDSFAEKVTEALKS